MFLPLLVASLLTVSASALEIVSEQKQSKTVQEISLSCPDTGYSVDGIAWTSCRAGRTVVVGCITPSGQKLKFGERYMDHRAEFECVDEGDVIILRPVACVFKDEKHEIGSTFAYKKFYYECARTLNGLIVKAIGCADESGDMVSLGEEFRKGSFIFLCQERDGGDVETVGVKCIVDSVGEVYSIGERYPLGDYYFECKKKGDRSVKTEVVGCADSEKQFVDVGQRYVSGRAVFECQIDGDSFRHAVVGCYAKDHKTDVFSQYKLGDVFYESYKDDMGFIKQCTFINGSIRHKTVECIYHEGSIDHHIDIGCGALIGKKVFICTGPSEKSSMARLMSIPKGSSFETVLAEHEVKKCLPRSPYVSPSE